MRSRVDFIAPEVPRDIFYEEETHRYMEINPSKANIHCRSANRINTPLIMFIMLKFLLKKIYLDLQ